MVKIYVSSTYVDLVEHREALCRALRRNAHEVTNMEDYVAEDRRPLTVCLADVAKCDVYVGIFAWRYGYIPADDNPYERSITELEFRHAVDNGKGCLIFLLDPDANWKISRVEQGPGMARLEALRDELARDYTPKFFKDVDELATEALTAINNWEARRRERANGHDTCTVRQGLNALNELMWTPSVQAAVASFRTEFSAACEQIDVLGNDKDVHDQLHNLQQLCYNPLMDARRLPDPELPWSQIEAYKVHIQPVIDCLQMIAERPSVTSIDISWVQDLVDARVSLDEATEKVDPHVLREAIWLIQSVVTVQPSRINTCLRSTTNRLVPRLSNLVKAMTQVREDLNRMDAAHPGLDSGKVRQFEFGVDSLIRLKDSLDTLVTEHDRWQAVDDSLRMIENGLDQETDQFAWTLRRSVRATEALYIDRAEGWARSLKAKSERLLAAIEAHNCARIRDIFLGYRSEAGYRFYVVDRKLKSLCDQLRNIDEPLAGVLREIDS